MGLELQHQNTNTGAFEATKGSSGRLNVSARADTRLFYNSRDKSETYVTTFSDPSAAQDTFSFYLKNDSTNKQMVVHAILVSTTALMTIEMMFVSGNASGGNSLTPFCLNQFSPHIAQALARGDDSITGLTPIGGFGAAIIPANGTVEVTTGDAIRIGPGQAVALYNKLTAGADLLEGAMTVYFE